MVWNSQKSWPPRGRRRPGSLVSLLYRAWNWSGEIGPETMSGAVRVALRRKLGNFLTCHSALDVVFTRSCFDELVAVQHNC